MIFSKENLERQQLLLKALGFYNGVVNGVWGPDSIEAKKAFEASLQFRPAIPNNGMPFSDTGSLPSGVYRIGSSGLLHHPALDELLKKQHEEAAAEALKVETPTSPKAKK